MTALLIAVVVLAVAWLVVEVMRADAALADTFDEHFATAAALLRPDDDRLPADTPHADALEAWLRSVTPQES